MSSLVRGSVFLGAAALVLPLSIAAAQTVERPISEQTPPELRGFRLDTPPLRDAAPQPAAENPPAVAPRTATSPRPATPRTTASAQRPSAPRVETSEAPPESPVSDALPMAIDGVPSPALPELPPETATEKVAPASSAPALLHAYWPWLAGFAALALLTIIGLMIGRRRRTALDRYSEAAPPNLAPLRSTKQPGPPARLPPAIAPAPLPSQIGALAAMFEPIHASLSLANLAVAGKLVIRHTGDTPLRDLRVRSTMISATEGQAALIRAFHDDPDLGQVHDIGNAKPGETITLTLEVSVPRNTLHSFDWKNRQFLAPIIVINLAAREGDEVRIAHLIGREAQPPAARMKPLPVDRGPKRFAEIGFRPIPA